MNVFQLEEGSTAFSQVKNTYMGKTKFMEEQKEDPVYIRRKLRLDKMTKLGDEDSKMPVLHLYKFYTTDLGCNNLKFSPSGRLLATSNTAYGNKQDLFLGNPRNHNVKTSLPIYDVEDGKL